MIKKVMTESEYRREQFISASSIQLFYNDRKKFYKEFIQGQVKDDNINQSMLIGNLVHTLLLEEENFYQKYHVSSIEYYPTDNMLQFCDLLYKYTIQNLGSDGKLNIPFLEVATMAYNDCDYKISLSAVLKRFDATGQQYYTELLEYKSKGIDVISQDDLAIASKIVDICKKDHITGPIFRDTSAFHEIKITDFVINEIPFKAMLDKVIVDHNKKTIQIYDLKVVYENYSFYREYFLKKKAYLQGLIYKLSLESRIYDLGFDYKDYTILDPIFIAIDSGCFNRPLMYRLDSEKAKNGFDEGSNHYKGLDEVLVDLKWAMESEIWNISKEDYENNGFVQLKLR
jgi:hypothetical protein